MVAQHRDSGRRRRAWLIWTAVGFAVVSITCTRQSGGPERPGGGTSSTAGVTAGSQPPRAHSNQASCVSCHENLKDEAISRIHDRRQISCTDCHGQSAAHVAGGSPQPEPDHVFAGAEIDKKCSECHRRHSPAAIERIVKRREGRTSPHGRPITTESTCTDCHGKHVREG